MEVPLLAGYMPHFMMALGIITMGFAGVRYWDSDPFRFLLSPFWDIEARMLFRAPGYPLYVLGSLLALAGPAIFAIRWFALHAVR